MSLYPYLFIQHPRYGEFDSYKEATLSIREANKEKCQSYVTSFWPHAHIYEHGPEWTVLPLDWRDRERIKKENSEIYIPLTLSATITMKKDNKDWSDEEKQLIRNQREEYVWKIAALTMIERARTDELKILAVQNEG